LTSKRIILFLQQNSLIRIWLFDCTTRLSILTYGWIVDWCTMLALNWNKKYYFKTFLIYSIRNIQKQFELLIWLFCTLYDSFLLKCVHMMDKWQTKNFSVASFTLWTIDGHIFMHHLSVVLSVICALCERTFTKFNIINLYYCDVCYMMYLYLHITESICH
jgi:hypothetical protein